MVTKLASLGAFFSGVGALSALIISLSQIKKNSKFNEANFWLTLREMFNTSNRVNIHEDLRKGKWIAEVPKNHQYWIKLEDYLGIFEICERMLARRIINKKMFISLYEYRIYNFLANKEIAKRKLILEYSDWFYFYKLLKRIYGKSWIEFYEFLKRNDHIIKESESETTFIQAMSKSNKEKYNKFKESLNLAE
ncbi:MAG: hypothetical protein MI739_02465 [Bacteroidales bacterium]|nr:hypothetical protein [Bacteroidales bacterium]